MQLADEVRGQIEAFISGSLGPRELEGWLDSAADEIHAEIDPNLRQLTGRVYIVLAEVADSSLSLQDATAELADLLVTTPAHIEQQRRAADTVTRST